jgi:type IV secretion system protein VirD4
MSGLPIGRLMGATQPTRWQAVLGLFNCMRSSGDAVRQFMQAFRDVEGLGPVLRLNNSVHTLTIAPPGAGKTTGLVVPFVRTCRDSMVINDIKGEIYCLTASHRRAMGHTIVALDPWHLVAENPATLNPFDWEDANDPESVDFARDLAESVVVRGAHDENHWPEMSEVFIGGVVSAVMNFCTPERRHLLTAANVLADRTLLDEAIAMLRDSGAWNGILARFGHVMSHTGKEELESILSTSNRMLRFVNSPAVTASLRTSSFDPGQLVKRRMTVYLIVPAHHLRAMAGLIRLWYSTFHRAVIRGGIQQ